MRATELPHARTPAVARPALAAALLLLATLAACDDGGGEAGGFEVAAAADRVAGNAPLQVAFTAEHRGPLDEALTYEWDFGDGESSEEPEPTHTYATPGDYAVTLRITAEGGDRGDDALAIAVSPPADLQISDVGAAPRRTRAGDTVTVAWGVRNAGAAVVGEWEQVVFLSATPAHGPDVIEIARLARRDDATDSEDSVQLEVTLPADVPNGDWYVGVIADPEQRVGDVDRADNVGFISAPLQVRNATEDGPDLTPCAVVIPDFAALPAGGRAVAQLGDQLAVQVCATNIGNRAVARFGYTIYLSGDDALDDADTVVGVRGDIALGPGDRETFDDLVDLAPELGAGEWRLLVAMDAEDVVEERNEQNNERGWADPFQLVEPGDVEGVDLVIAGFDLDFEGERLFRGQSAMASITVGNRGDAPVERSFVLRVQAEPLDGSQPVQVASFNVPRIEALGQVPVELPVRISQQVDEGSYRLVAIVDPTNGVGDVNPGNNRRVLQRVFTLGGTPDVDAAVRQVTFDPEAVEAGDEIEVSVVLTNLGEDATGELEVAVYLSPRAASSDGAVEVDRFDLESLGGGDTRPVERTITVPVTLDQQIGEWHVGVVVDASQRLAEIDEDNNTLFAEGALAVSGATGGCDEDEQFEDNDAAGAAAPIEAGEHPGLGLCDADDWFQVQVPPGEVLEAAIAWDEAEGGLALRLTDAAGDLIQAGEATPGAARVFAQAAPEARTLLLHVSGATLAYDLEVSLTPADPRPDLRVRSVALVPGVVRPGGPVDVTFDVVNTGLGEAGASEASIYLTAGGEPDPAMAGLVTLPVPAVPAGEAVRPMARIVVPDMAADGLYRVFVVADTTAAVDESAEGNNSGSAELRVDRVQACAVDEFEPNRSPRGDAPAASAVVPPGEHADLTTCAADDDWYGVELQAADRLDVSVDFEHDDGDLELELYDTDGESLLERSAQLQDRETVTLLRAPVAGRYFVRVFVKPGANAVSNLYRLTVTVTDEDACEDDAFEPNDENNPQILRDGPNNLVICAGDEDWFRFNIPAGNAVSFQLAGGAAGVTIALFDPNGVLVDESDRRIFLNARLNGFYELRVRAEGAVEALNYQLTVVGVGGVDLALADLRLEPAAASPGDDVRASFTLQNLRGDDSGAVLVRFWLSADADATDPDDLVIGEYRAARVAGAASLVVRHRLSLPAAAPAGDRRVVATVDPDRDVPDGNRANNTGTAPITIAPACVDDDQNENEGPGNASELEPGARAFDGVLCAFTQDWYALPVDDAGRVTVRLIFDAERGDLDLYVHDADGDLLGSSRTDDSPEEVTIDLDAPGMLLIRVDGFFEAANEYRLEWGLP